MRRLSLVTLGVLFAAGPALAQQTGSLTTILSPNGSIGSTLPGQAQSEPQTGGRSPSGVDAPPPGATLEQGGSSPTDPVAAAERRADNRADQIRRATPPHND